MADVVIGGALVQVDDADMHLIAAHPWRLARHRCAVYVIAYGRRGVPQLALHRLILNAPKGMDVDHRNSDGLDNRRANLRVATRAQNMQNRRVTSASSTGLKGAHYYASRVGHKKYRAEIAAEGRRHKLGWFATAQEAHAVYVAAAQRLHGEFARAA